MKSYDHASIEKKWQKKWESDKLYETADKVEGRENFYVLSEFPYPSGNLHVGHWYAFVGPDILARYKSMSGKNVLFPIGFDAFGLPAENAAIKRNLNPRDWTISNIDFMRDQFKSMGTSFDWSREVSTCDPRYYKWTQWLFLQLFKNDLAYQAETAVNWCPSCKTVLANEQVINGACERCGTTVEQKQMKQWLFGITKYADRLVDDLEKLDWPEEIKTAQKNWIGRSEGARVIFKVKDSEIDIPVYTTRIDTIFAGTFVIIAPEHSLVQELKNSCSNVSEIDEYVKKTATRTELERLSDDKTKSGVEMKGAKALNPATGEEVPVWIADYVLAQYGTGAVMGVPAHDKRDFDFAKKYSITIRTSIESENEEEFFGGEGIVTNSEQFNGMTSAEAREKITAWLAEKNLAEPQKIYKLRDWLVSRQRYWGCPIPVIHCEKCGAVAVPDAELTVILPDIDDFLPRDDGRSPLAKAENWLHVDCPKCGGKAERETDTLDTFIDSSWYFLRYLDPKNEKEFASQEKMENWMPINFYSGGAEHTTMHLLYSRFFYKALKDLNLVPRQEQEPFTRRLNRGLILGTDGNKMSKSKGNVIDPDEIVERLGADTVRMYLAFIGPYNEVGYYPWDPNGVVGIRRFLEKVWGLTEKGFIPTSSPEIISHLQETIVKVTTDCERLKFNTAISHLMVFVTAAQEKGIAKEEFGTFLKLLAPFAPHLAEELWSKIGHNTSIHLETFPQADQSKILTQNLKIAIQINGKVRATIEFAPDTTEDEIKETALSNESVKKWLEGKEIKKIVYVKGKLLSIALSTN